MTEGNPLRLGDLDRRLGKLKLWGSRESRKPGRRRESERDRARRIPIFCIFFLMLMEGAPVLTLVYLFDADRWAARIAFFGLLLTAAWALGQWPLKRYAGQRAGAIVAKGGATRLTSLERALAWWLGGWRVLALIFLATVPSLALVVTLADVKPWWFDSLEHPVLQELLRQTAWFTTSLIFLCLVLWLTARKLGSPKA